MSDMIGANQADTMLRRVSPEGRARAARERERRQKHALRLAGRLTLLAIAALALIGVADVVLGTLSGTSVGAILIVVLIAAAVIAYGSRPRPVAAAQLETSALPALPIAVAAWLEDRQRTLPRPAVGLSDAISTRLRELAPQLHGVDPREPAADAVRRLLAVELPDLIERHQAVPARLRSQARGDGHSADDHLLNGLGIVEDEVVRMTAELARGDLDALATRDRFLELKYQGDEISNT